MACGLVAGVSVWVYAVDEHIERTEQQIGTIAEWTDRQIARTEYEEKLEVERKAAREKQVEICLRNQIPLEKCQ